MISFKISKRNLGYTKKIKKIYNIHAKGHERKRGTKMPAEKREKKHSPPSPYFLEKE